jgi:diguanylate cyclase (GGDEF)-like protein
MGKAVEREWSIVFAVLDGLTVAAAAVVGLDPSAGGASVGWRIAIAAGLLAVVVVHRVAWMVVARRAAARLGAGEQARRRLATHDPVTGLRNRYLVVDELRRRAGEPGYRPVVMIVEIDQLETIKHTLGHDQSDALVLRTAQRLRDAAGDIAELGRLDGGEFVLVADAGEAAEALPQRVLAAVAEPQLLDAFEVVTTASIGVARGDGRGDPADLVREASLAVADARRAGGGTIGRGDAARRADALGRLRLANDLRRAVPDRELEVYYQPIVALPDRRVTGAEALIRWNHPREGVLTPDRWLDVADDTGLLPEIGRSTLDEVCRRFATLNARRRDELLRITVNLSVSELRQPDLPAFIGTTLDSSGLDADALVLDIAGAALDDEVAIVTLQQLRDLGVRVSLDDFGTGFAALGWLGHVPVQELKLDRTLVERLDDQSGGIDVARALVDLCIRLGMDVTAEAVSTEIQADRLAAIGCANAQGWLFGRPLPYSRFAGWLERMDHEREQAVEAATAAAAEDEAAPAGSDAGAAAARARREASSPLDRLR